MQSSNDSSKPEMHLKTYRVHVRIKVSSRSKKLAYRDIPANSETEARNELLAILVNDKALGTTVVPGDVEFIGSHHADETCKLCEKPLVKLQSRIRRG